MYKTPEPGRRAWRKSTRSGGNGCVEVSLDPQSVGVRDSKDLGGPEFFVNVAAWRGFVREVSTGRFDDATASGA